MEGIDLNQVDSLQLKDGTVVKVQNEEEGFENDNQFLEEEEQICEECAGALENDYSNQLRARPMLGHPIRPKPSVFPVVPMRQAVVKPMVVPRVPVRPTMPMGRVVFRARPGNIGQNRGGYG